MKKIGPRKFQSFPSFNSHHRALVRAGTKTQTRRLRGLQLINIYPDDWSLVGVFTDYKTGNFKAQILHIPTGRLKPLNCPLKSKIDFYLKEPLAVHPERDIAVYQDDGEIVLDDGKEVPWKWKRIALDQTYLPKRYARTKITLLEIRLQRVKEISQDDAIAEGYSSPEEYVRVFQDINKPGKTGDRNPWCWCYTFKLA